MAGNTGAIKAGRAFVELFVDDNKLYRGLDLAATKLKAWGLKLRNTGAALGAGGGAILGPLLASLKEVTGRANDMQLLADRIGETVGNVSTLAGGFERAGVDAEAFAGIMEGLKIKVAEAADANGYLLENLKSLGPAARMAGLPVREMLSQIAEKIAAIPSAIQQTRAAKGLGLESLLPSLRKGRAGIDELFANGAPGGITTEQGRQAVAVTKAVREAWGDFKDTLREVGYALLPTAAGIADMKAQFKAGLGSVRDWIKENKGAVLTLAAVGVGLVTAGGLMVGFGLTVSAAGTAIALSLAGIKAAFGLVLSPLGALALGVYLLANHTEAGREATAGLRSELAALGTRAKETFGAITEAVGSGDWTRAFRIGLAYLKAEWAGFNVYFVEAWNWTKELFVDGWHFTIRQLKTAFVDLGAFIMRNTVGVLRSSLVAMGAALRTALPGVAGRRAAEPFENAAGGIDTDEEINRKRDRGNARLKAEEIAERRAREESRRGDLLDAKLAASNARIALGELIGGGGRTGGGGAWSGIMGQIAEAVGNVGGAGGFHGPTRMADAVKGGFGSAAISQQFALGDTIPAQQLDALRGVNVNTAAVPQMARDLNIIARGGRVGA